MAGGGIAEGQNGDCGGLFLGVLLIIPILTWIWTVFPQKSTGSILPGICQGKGGHEQLRFPPALSPKGTHTIPFLGRWNGQREARLPVLCPVVGWEGRAGDTGSCGEHG